jgi:hypothetical protein
MNFLEIIRWMVILIIIVITAFVGRVFVFEHIEVFLKGLPPTQVWHPIMRLTFSVINSLFHWILIFLVIMYILYVIIRTFVPKIILLGFIPIPLRAILLAITPLYELRVAGIFPLFDAIIGAIFSRASIGARLISVIRAIARFLAGPFYLLRGQGHKVVINGPNFDPDAPLLPPPEKGDQFHDDNEGEAKYDPSLSPNENRYIQKDYQQCISENYSTPTEDMSPEEKSLVTAKNSGMKVLCDVKRLQSYGKLVTAKFL